MQKCTASLLTGWYFAACLALSTAGAAARAEAPRTTKVYAVWAHYSDTVGNAKNPAKLRNVMQSVRAFYAEGSAGTHGFVADVHPTPLELAQTRPQGKCRLPDGSVLSEALRAAGISLEGYHALALVVPPSTNGCNGGLQTSFLHQEADGTVHRVPLAISWSLTDRFIAHEIVHTHGIGHAKALVCRGTTLAPDCRTEEYGNVWDVMGDGSYHMLSAPLRTRMGWIEPVVHGAGNASHTIGAATRPGGLPTALQVRLPFTGSSTMKVLQPLNLWIEYRAPFGFDRAMASPRFANFANGAMVNLTGSWQATVGKTVRTVSCPVHSPCLLDMTPQTGTFNDAGLVAGQTWTEPLTGIQVTVDARTETTLTVTVVAP